MDTYLRLRKCLVVGLILVFLGASTTFGVNASCINPQLPRVVHQTVQAIQQEIVGQPCPLGNALISNISFCLSVTIICLSTLF